MDAALIVNDALVLFSGAVSLIEKLRAEGALTDDQIAAAARQQLGGNDAGIRAILAQLSAPAQPAAPAAAPAGTSSGS